MNPYNLLLNYIFANSRNEYYGVSDTNKSNTQNVALAFSFFDNPIVGFLAVDSAAKNNQALPVNEPTKIDAPISISPSPSSNNTLEVSKVREIIKEYYGEVKNELSRNKEELVAETTKIIKEEVAKTLKETISSNFLKSANPEAQVLIDRASKESKSYLIKQHLSDLIKTKESISFISKNKYFNELSEEDKTSFKNINELLIEKGVLDDLIKLDEKYQEIEITSFLFIPNFDRSTLGIKERLQRIALEKEANSNLSSSSAATTAPKTTGTKK